MIMGYSKTNRWRYCCLLMFLWSPLLGASTLEQYPLAPPNTGSPRSTIKSFIDSINTAHQLFINAGSVISGKHKDNEIKFYVKRALRCLDLSQVAPTVLEDTGIESALLLKEVLDRIEVPPYEEIPDSTAMQKQPFKKWVLPHTEISIALMAEGPRQGEYLFTAETVNRVRSFYKRVKDLPYKPGASVGAYEDYILAAGSMIPPGLIRALPDFMKIEVYEQAVWQWLAMLLLLAMGMAVLLGVFQVTRRMPHREADGSPFKSFLRKILLPLAIISVISLSEYLLNDQINITGVVLKIVMFGIEIIFFMAVIWAIGIIGNAIAKWFIAQPSIHSESIDANFIRIIARIATIAIVFVLVLRASSHMGVSLTAVFASAGIAGLALALAARETIANFFGGINILIDRPFKVGHYIILDSGERGEVVDVGLRSTRIITRDDVQISIPNSIITDAKIINESVPQNRFRVRIKISVAYGSDVDQVERLLLKTAKDNTLIALLPEPRVRFRNFGDSALEFELLCWAYKPDIKGQLVHQLNCSIYKAFNKADIRIPFPQRDVHVIKSEEDHEPETNPTINRAGMKL
jgi:MscS family membrane protein